MRGEKKIKKVMITLHRGEKVHIEDIVIPDIWFLAQDIRRERITSRMKSKRLREIDYNDLIEIKVIASALKEHIISKEQGGRIKKT